MTTVNRSSHKFAVLSFAAMFLVIIAAMIASARFLDHPESDAENALMAISADQHFVQYRCDGYAPTLSWLAKWSHESAEKRAGTPAYSFTMVVGPPVESDLCKDVVFSYFISATPRPGTKNGLEHYGLNSSGLYKSPSPVVVTLIGTPPGTSEVLERSLFHRP